MNHCTAQAHVYETYGSNIVLAHSETHGICKENTLVTQLNAQRMNSFYHENYRTTNLGTLIRFVYIFSL